MSRPPSQKLHVSPYILDLSIRGTSKMAARPKAVLAAPPVVNDTERRTRSDSAFLIAARRVSDRRQRQFFFSTDTVRDVPYVFPGRQTGTSRAADSAETALINRDPAVMCPGEAPIISDSSPAGIVLPPGRIFGSRLGVLGWFNGSLLAIGCLLLAFAVHDLQAWPVGFQRLALVRQQAQAALQRLAAAQSAVAAADLPAGKAAFTDASIQLAQAQADLQIALTSTQRLAAAADVTGTFRDGETLLSAGELLASAGQQLAAGLSLLADSSVIAGGGAAGGQTLTESLAAAKDPFKAAFNGLRQAQVLLRSVRSPLLPAAVRDQAQLAAAQAERGVVGLRAYLTQSDALLTLLGADRQRQYLLVFQNSHELRPTGGFIGSIGLVDIDRGVMENVDVLSVYDPDGQLKEFIAPPHPLSAVTNRWFLRDANWFVDFPTSARKLISFFEKEGGPTPDGVIAVTPYVVRDLVALAGPITMPQYGVTVTAENFWELTQDQVTYSYDREMNRPKQFMADLTPVLMNRLLQDPAVRMRTMATILSAASEKQLLLYFRDEAVQQKMVQAGWAGVFPGSIHTLLAVNTANIAGHKSDQFVDQQLDWDIRVQPDESAEVQLTITRTHRGPEEGVALKVPAAENPAYKDNVVYQRVFPPSGAELLAVEGVTAPGEVPRLVTPVPDLPLVPDADVVEWQRRQRVLSGGTVAGHEAGAAFFAHWMVTSPGESRTVVYRFRVPAALDLPSLFDPASRVEALLVKQPGDERTFARVSLHFPPGVRVAHAVPAAGGTAVSDREFTYRGELKRDTAVGAVLEKQ